MNRLVEDIVICVVLALCMLTALGFLIAIVAYDQPYPPTAVSAFLGIAIAALTYRFLGGTEDTQFAFGALKLGGSAALLFAFTYFGGNWIARDQQLLADSGEYIKLLKTKDDRIFDQREEIERAEEQIRALQQQLDAQPDARRSLTLAELRDLSPNDVLVRDIRQMVRNQDAPFAETLNDVEARISVVNMAGSGARYQICRAKLSELKGSEITINSRVRLARSLTNGELRSVTAERNGLILDSVCNADNQDFEMQINCVAARILFEDEVTNCAATGPLRGDPITISSLPL